MECNGTSFTVRKIFASSGGWTHDHQKSRTVLNLLSYRSSLFSQRKQLWHICIMISSTGTHISNTQKQRRQLWRNCITVPSSSLFKWFNSLVQWWILSKEWISSKEWIGSVLLRFKCFSWLHPVWNFTEVSKKYTPIKLLGASVMYFLSTEDQPCMTCSACWSPAQTPYW